MQDALQRKMNCRAASRWGFDPKQNKVDLHEIADLATSASRHCEKR
jgi:hypothetical protein